MEDNIAEAHLLLRLFANVLRGAVPNGGGGGGGGTSNPFG